MIYMMKYAQVNTNISCYTQQCNHFNVCSLIAHLCCSTRCHIVSVHTVSVHTEMCMTIQTRVHHQILSHSHGVRANNGSCTNVHVHVLHTQCVHTCTAHIVCTCTCTVLLSSLGIVVGQVHVQCRMHLSGFAVCTCDFP